MSAENAQRLDILAASKEICGVGDPTTSIVSMAQRRQHVIFGDRVLNPYSQEQLAGLKTRGRSAVRSYMEAMTAIVQTPRIKEMIAYPDWVSQSWSDTVASIRSPVDQEIRQMFSSMDGHVYSNRRNVTAYAEQTHWSQFQDFVLEGEGLPQQEYDEVSDFALNNIGLAYFAISRAFNEGAHVALVCNQEERDPHFALVQAMKFHFDLIEGMLTRREKIGDALSRLAMQESVKVSVDMRDADDYKPKTEDEKKQYARTDPRIVQNVLQVNQQRENPHQFGSITGYSFLPTDGEMQVDYVIERRIPGTFADEGDESGMSFIGETGKDEVGFSFLDWQNYGSYIDGSRSWLEDVMAAHEGGGNTIDLRAKWMPPGQTTDFSRADGRRRR